MKKSGISFVFALFFLAVTTLNAAPLSDGQLSLESLCAALSSSPNTLGDFTQTKTIASNGRQLKSSGKFIISPLGIMWKTEKPFPSSLILTKTSMIQISANGKKNIMDGKDNQLFENISTSLSSVFSGNLDALQTAFFCDFSNLFESGESKWRLTLKAKDSTIASVMEKIVLSGSFASSENKAELQALEIFEASNNSIRYEFFNQKYPEELSADEKQNFIE